MFEGDVVFLNKLAISFASKECKVIEKKGAEVLVESRANPSKKVQT